jgi:predicted transcriptional regulator
MSYEIEKLGPRHIQVMDLVIAGEKQTEIAKRLKLSQQAVSSIVNSEVFQEQLPKRRLELQQATGKPRDECEEAARVLQNGALAAAKRLVELLDCEDERVQLAAAIAILDRTGHGKMLHARCTVESRTLTLSAKDAQLLCETLMMVQDN